MEFQDNKPYIFFSYAHKDAELSLKIIKALTDAKFNIWYDEGIEVGTEYSDYIAEHIECCRVFVCVMDENYLESEYCRDEINFAVDNHKEILIIYPKEIRELNIPAGIRMRTSRYQAVFYKRSKNFEGFIGELCESKILSVCSLLEKTPAQKLEKKVKKPAEPEVFEPTYEQQKKAAQIIDTFALFGIKVEAFTGVFEGPRVTRYEFRPDAGVKLAKIASLSDDMALTLSAGQIRMICPIPGKAAFGIEIPNGKEEKVDLDEILASEEYAEKADPLKIALGRDISSKPVCMELSRMPHLLVGGQAFSGKQSLFHTMIMSLMHNNTPEDLRLLIIDPRKGELSVYSESPYLLRPVITEPREAIDALLEIMDKVDSRLKLFSERGIRTLDAYNGCTSDTLPRIVVFISEMRNLIEESGAEFEMTVCNIAQRARAAGIHMVLATAEPGPKNVPGMIKANIPSRICLSVTEAVDSRTIIDHQGAEKLLPRGDMLYCPIGAMTAMRVQAAYIPYDEVALRVKVKAEGFVPEKKEISADAYEAVLLGLRFGALSAALIQQKLGFGYNKALRILKELEALEIISAKSVRGQPRKMRITEKELLNFQRKDKK